MRNINTINGYFNKKLAKKILEEHGQADFFIANHTFSNIVNNIDFIEGINLLLKLHEKTVKGKTVDIKVANKLKNKSQRGTVIEDLKKGLKDLLGNKFKEMDLVKMQDDMKEDQFLSWVYSKSQGVQLAQIVESIKNKTKRDQLCEDFYLYANSRSAIASAYYKLE